SSGSGKRCRLRKEQRNSRLPTAAPVLHALPTGGQGRVRSVQAMSKSGRLLDESVVFSRNIDWNLFKVFREIARHGGVGAAARALNRQQPSISAALKRLEAHVGVPLCVRSSRGVVLTAFGRELLAICEGMYTSVQDIPRAANREKRDVRGQVTLRVISNL